MQEEAIEQVQCRLYERAHLEFHVSIVVFDWEYSYGSDGVIISEPSKEKCKSYVLGRTTVQEEELNSFVSNNRSFWKGELHNPVDRNCHSFTKELCKFLGVYGVLGAIVENKLIKFCSKCCKKFKVGSCSSFRR